MFSVFNTYTRVLKFLSIITIQKLVKLFELLHAEIYHIHIHDKNWALIETFFKKKGFLDY